MTNNIEHIVLIWYPDYTMSVDEAFPVNRLINAVNVIHCWSKYLSLNCLYNKVAMAKAWDMFFSSPFFIMQYVIEPSAVSGQQWKQKYSDTSKSLAFTILLAEYT